MNTNYPLIRDGFRHSCLPPQILNSPSQFLDLVKNFLHVYGCGQAGNNIRLDFALHLLHLSTVFLFRKQLVMSKTIT